MADPRDRVRRILQAKGRAASRYWTDHGRRRFAAELAADGVPAPEIEAILRDVDAEMTGDLLDMMLSDLRRRVGGSV